MTVVQLSGGIVTLAIILAVARLLEGRIRITTLRPLRIQPRPCADGDAGGASPMRTRRGARSERPTLQALNDVERAGYAEWWRQMQRRVIAQPATTLLDADDLLVCMLDAIGYPTDGFVQYAPELSLAHAEVVDDYRAARSVVLDTRLGLADTAQIRQAIARYTAVFECLADLDVSSRAKSAA